MYSKRSLRVSLIVSVLLFFGKMKAQEEAPVDMFWNELKEHCGKAYTGNLVLPEEDPQFSGKELVMHVRSCEENVIKIPFFVGDDKSRTWILTKVEDRVILKHDHRHEDGTEDEITMYGGKSTNSGNWNLQLFPADAETQKMIPGAASNVWWITIDEKEFTYNLRRIGTDRVFKVVFKLATPTVIPSAPWGWKN